jgi:Acetyltransferase (GNAT) domain
MSGTRVVTLEPSAYGEWDGFVAASPDGAIYATAAYLDVLCAVAGGRFRILAVRRGDELAGGVALYERHSPFGDYVSPRLLLYYNGLVLRRYETKYPSQQTARDIETLRLLAEAIDAARYGQVLLKSRETVKDLRPFITRGWSARPGYSYVVPLADPPALWQRMEQNLRRLVTRCETRDRLSWGDDDDFDSFYRLHEITLGRKDVAAYLPHDAFATYVSRLRAAGLARLFHARLPDGRSIASQLVLLGGHPVSHTVSAAGDPEFSKLGAQAFLRWKVFEALAGLGYRANDLTDAGLNPVTHFKAQLGGDLTVSLVLESPGTRAYRWGTALRALPRRARAAVGRMARRALGRSTGP